jgi:putative membrane protein
MSPEVQAFASGFPIMLLHTLLSLGLLTLGGAAYAMLSPHREIQRIREGNSAAAVSFAGVLIGLAIPLAASLAAATSLLEIGLWGAPVVVLALLAFRLIDAGLAGLPERMREGEVAAAVVLVAARLGAALIFAAALAL